MVLGILGLVFWVTPLFGLPINIVGLCLGISAKKKAPSGKATAGIVMTIVGLSLTAVIGIVGALLGSIMRWNMWNIY